jgi:TatD DNase family protein
MWIDVHCHINCFPRNEIKDLVSSCKESLFIDSSTNYRTSLLSLEISKEHRFIYSSLGFHPFWAEEFSDETINKYEKLIDSNLGKVIAIGEVGLDFKAETPLEEQERIFGEFINLAKRKNLPLIIHNRLNSFKILNVLDNFFSSYEKIIFHCFSYSEDFLEKIISKKGYVSFSLNLLRKKEELIESLKRCPLEHLILETDSPYMKIENRPSSPLDIKKLYSFVANIRSVKEEILKESIFSNVKKVFSLMD